MDNIELFKPPVELEKQIDRLYKITGFVTILHEAGDCRSLGFARYYHVRRVVWLSHFIARNKINNGEDLDIDKVMLLAWAHDLNRWPFSHNSEKGLFNQGEDVSRYLIDNNLNGYIGYEPDISRIIAKEYSGLSSEGKVVLLADMLTGFIEDPLWATTALNITWDIIPQNVAEYLGLPINDKLFLAELYKLNILFFESDSHLPIIRSFDPLFQKLASSFVIKEGFINKNPLGKQYFEDKRLMIKEQFMRKVIFSYNNEKISKGTFLKSKLIKPFINLLDKNETNKVLTSIDEEQFIDMAINKYHLITHDEIKSFLPKLNYIEEFEPRMSFRANYKKIISL